MDSMQLQLWEQATPDDIREAKQLLCRYRRLQTMHDSLRTKPELSEKQRDFLSYCLKCLQDIDQAVNLILDDEIRRIIEFRFLKGMQHKVTILHYNGMMHPSTVDRKIAKGIESVANTLKIIR